MHHSASLGLKMQFLFFCQESTLYWFLIHTLDSVYAVFNVEIISVISNNLSIGVALPFARAASGARFISPWLIGQQSAPPAVK